MCACVARACGEGEEVHLEAFYKFRSLRPETKSWLHRWNLDRLSSVFIASRILNGCSVVRCFERTHGRRYLLINDRARFSKQKKNIFNYATQTVPPQNGVAAGEFARSYATPTEKRFVRECYLARTIPTNAVASNFQERQISGGTIVRRH